MAGIEDFEVKTRPVKPIVHFRPTDVGGHCRATTPQGGRGTAGGWTWDQKVAPCCSATNLEEPKSLSLSLYLSLSLSLRLSLAFSLSLSLWRSLSLSLSGVLSLSLSLPLSLSLSLSLLRSLSLSLSLSCVLSLSLSPSLWSRRHLACFTAILVFRGVDGDFQ